VFNHVCFNVLTTASVMTVVFNANPLMRFDGYYLLSDVLELPNLYGQGQQYVRDGWTRLLLGVRSHRALDPGLRGVLVRCYGVASGCWRYLVLLGLVLAAATLLEGAGVVLSVAAVAWWCRGVVRRAACFARSPLCTGRAVARCAAVSAAALVLGAAVLLLTPWPGAVVIPAVIHYAPETIVRTESDGFVTELRVHSGQLVVPGDVLAVLVNQELAHEVSDLEVAVAITQLQRRVYVGQGASAKAQVEREKLRVLEARLAEKRAQLSRLIVRAPRAGQVVGRNLSSLCGTYLRQGSALVAIVDESAKEVCLSIAQSDFDAVCARIGHPVRVYVSSVGVLQAPLAKVEPRASKRPADPALGAAYGGPLPVRRHEAAAPESDARQYELLAPRFTGVLTLSAGQSRAVYAGQLADVALHADQSLGAHLMARAADWVALRLHRPRRDS
jgi:putative peptide zinc metalloprotease protein